MTQTIALHIRSTAAAVRRAPIARFGLAESAGFAVALRNAATPTGLVSTATMAARSGSGLARPDSSESGANAQDVRDAAQDSRKTESDPDRKDKSAEAGDVQGGGEAGSEAVHARLPDQPLTIKSFNDLLLTVDPAVLAMRGAAPRPGTAVPARDSASAAQPRERVGSARIESATEHLATEAHGATDPQATSPASGGTLPQRETSPERTPGAKPAATPTAESSGSAQAQASPPANGGSMTSHQSLNPATGTDTSFAAVPVVSTQVTAGGAASSEPGSSAISAIDGGRDVGRSPLSLRAATLRDSAAPTSSNATGETPFAAQIARGIAAALVQQKDGDTARSVTLRLQPATLGQVRVELGVEGQSVTARFEATTPEARDLLGQSLATLRASLESRGLHVERLHVDLDHAQSIAGSAGAAHGAPEPAPQLAPLRHGATQDWSGQTGGGSDGAWGGAGGSGGGHLWADPRSTGQMVAAPLPTAPVAGPARRSPTRMDPGSNHDELMLHLGIDTLA